MTEESAMTVNAETLSELKPGVYDHVPRSIYEAWDAVNFSTLKAFGRTPAHAKHELDFPTEATPAQAMGDAVHAAILEPERFAREYIGAPKVDRRTALGKSVWAEFESGHPGKVRLSHGEYADAVAMRDAVWQRNGLPKALLACDGFSERSFVWTHPATGLMCKRRCDRMLTWSMYSVVLDVKTVRSAEIHAFSRDVANYQYHVQAAWYLDGLATIAPLERRWLWLLIEKEPPHLTRVLEPTERLLAQARASYHAWLLQYRAARESGVWPGYPDGIEEIDVPRWAQELEASQ
jgi:hypothetical protein